jgi:hypothetical protein
VWRGAITPRKPIPASAITGADLPERREYCNKVQLFAAEADSLSSDVRVHSSLFYLHWDI